MILIAGCLAVGSVRTSSDKVVKLAAYDASNTPVRPYDVMIQVHSSQLPLHSLELPFYMLCSHRVVSIHRMAMDCAQGIGNLRVFEGDHGTGLD